MIVLVVNKPQFAVSTSSLNVGSRKTKLNFYFASDIIGKLDNGPYLILTPSSKFRKKKFKFFRTKVCANNCSHPIIYIIIRNTFTQ